jgi:glycosyltransferase involved in cell wall biosynthesis
MDKILTISIAAYNMQDYLARCLDSLIAPEVMNDTEVLIINDGSKDNTLKIAQEYEKKYPNTFKAIDKPNGGHGSTINKGIELATGKYFRLLDADDWFDTSEFVKLVKTLRNTNCDIILNQHSHEYVYNKITIPQLFKNVEFGKIYTLSEPISVGRAWFELATSNYRTSILQENNIRISECFYCDIEYSAYPLKFVNTVMFLDLHVYKYFIGREGQSISSVSITKHYQDHLRITKNIIEWYKVNLNEENLAKKDIYHKMLIQKTSSNYIALMLHYSDRKQARKLLKEYDDYLKEQGKEIYNITGSSIKMYGLKPIAIWRCVRLNIYKTQCYHLMKWLLR